MAVTIDQELLTFYDKLSSAIGTVGSGISSLTSKLSELKSSNSSFSSDVSANYSGSGKETALNTFSSLNATIDAISTSITEGPLQVISESSDLISKIGDLKTLKDEIDSLESKLSSLGGKWSTSSGKSESEVSSHNSEIDTITTQKTEKETEFKTKHEEAKSKLAAIKAINPSINVASTSAATSGVPAEILADLSNVTPGTYQTLSYTGANGRTIKYSIYVPANASTTTGLPVHLYMGGSGEVGKMNAGGLAKLLTQGQQSSGIVIVLEASTSSDYTKPDYLETAKELTDRVVTTYKADTKRISISGHSLGGAGCLHMAEKYPDYFSIVAPVCGYNTNRGKQSGSAEQAYQNLSQVRILGYLGQGDTSSIDSMKSLYSKIKNSGNMRLITIPGGHRIQFKVFGEQVEIDGKVYANLLEYCLAQTKA
jgi:S-formylglutathione hydrolase FrmB